MCTVIVQPLFICTYILVAAQYYFFFFSCTITSPPPLLPISPSRSPQTFPPLHLPTSPPPNLPSFQPSHLPPSSHRSYHHRAQRPRSQTPPPQETLWHKTGLCSTRPVCCGPHSDIWSWVWAGDLLQWKDHLGLLLLPARAIQTTSCRAWWGEEQVLSRL